MRPIYEELEEMMKERAWSQTDLAVRAGVSPTTVSRYLGKKRGFRVDPKSIVTYRKFAAALDLPTGFFLEEQIDVALRELNEHVRKGFVTLPALNVLLVDARDREQLAHEDTGPEQPRSRRRKGPGLG